MTGRAGLSAEIFPPLLQILHGGGCTLLPNMYHNHGRARSHGAALRGPRKFARKGNLQGQAKRAAKSWWPEHPCHSTEKCVCLPQSPQREAGCGQRGRETRARTLKQGPFEPEAKGGGTSREQPVEKKEENPSSRTFPATCCHPLTPRQPGKGEKHP